MNNKHKGAFAELKAVTWLLEQNYEVFRAVSPHGDVDLIALDPETKETFLFDVTTGKYYVRQDGTRTLSFGLQKLDKLPKINVLVFIPETDEVIEVKEDCRGLKDSWRIQSTTNEE